MDVFEAIMTRRSLRSFSRQPISTQALGVITSAAMAGPSCVNARDWSFLVSDNKEVLAKMAAAVGKTAQPLESAPLGILVLGDLERAFKPAPDYWVIDGSIAAQNMILAAQGLGIGSVWLGVYPQTERVEALRELFKLPDTVIPHSIIAFGYSSGKDEADPRQPSPQEKGFFEPSRIHIDKW